MGPVGADDDGSGWPSSDPGNSAASSYQNILGARVGPVPLPRPASFGIADPPYPGKARRDYSADPRCAEVSTRILVGSLCLAHPDGWALATGSEQLQAVLGECPPGVRLGIWQRDRCFRPGPRPRTWEAVVVCGGRAVPDRQVLDLLVEPSSPVRGLVGAKPEAWGAWVLAMLGALPGDSLVDWFPGSGRVSRAALRCGLLVEPPGGA